MKTKLKFFKQDGRWYADVPEHSLEDNEMVLGADVFLELLSNGRSEVILNIATEERYVPWVKLAMTSHDNDGAEYILSGRLIDEMEEVGVNFPMTVWLCNVVHTVLGEHPETIYITAIY